MQVTSTPREIASRMERKSSIFILSLGIIAAVVLCWSVYSRKGASEFTSVAWHSATPDMRGKLSAQLARNGYLHGLSEDKVVELLGPPDFRGERIVYRFEHVEGRSLRSRSALIINLDRAGRAMRVNGSDFPEDIDAKLFDAEGWRTGTAKDRQGMALDILRRRILDGATRTEITATLGEPTRTSPPRLVYYARSVKGQIRGTGKKLIITLVDNKVSDVSYKGS